jgi:hypothetical protein
MKRKGIITFLRVVMKQCGTTVVKLSYRSKDDFLTLRLPTEHKAKAAELIEKIYPGIKYEIIGLIRKPKTV